LASLVLVWVLYATLSISYLWYNLIGCASCMILAAILQPILGVAPVTDQRSEQE
jgi:hypothetical protein